MFLYHSKAESDIYTPFDALLKDKRFWRTFRTSLAKELTPRFNEIFIAGAVAASKLKPGRATKASPEPASTQAFLDEYDIETIAEDAIRRYINPFTRGISDTTYNEVRDIVIRARRDGTTLEAVIESVSHLFSPERAQRIATTEVTRLFGQGAQAAYKAQGVTGWEWKTVTDFAVCDECDAMDGEQFPISDAFDAEHPDCRCFPAPVML